jgi:hypothetical protein
MDTGMGIDWGNKKDLLIHCNSHRAREKVFNLIPYRNGLYSFYRSTGKGVYPVWSHEFERIKHIKGIRRYTDGDDLRWCWS